MAKKRKKKEIQQLNKAGFHVAGKRVGEGAGESQGRGSNGQEGQLA